jgi:predicted CXXCH cytochrome family protein
MAGIYLFIFLILLASHTGRPESLSYVPPIQENCISCHGDLIKNQVIHPGLEKICDVCHTSTGDEHPKKNIKGFVLSEKLPGLCFSCHTDFQEHIDAYTSVHSPVKEGLSCINCHNPHSSPEKKLLLNGTNDLCLKCHNKTIVKDSTRFRNINQILYKAKSIHPPVEIGGCVNCHNPHFSEKRALLIGNFPSEQYLKATTDNLELCFMCHDTDLLEKQTTESGTNFRNGKLNLHFIHVSGEKGRNCTMCHDVHGAVNYRLIVDKLKFGSWEMKINFSLTANGGSCLTACHNERSYDRAIPEQPVPTKTEQKQSPVSKSATQETTKLR